MWSYVARAARDAVERLPLLQERPLVRYLLATALTALGFAVRYGLDDRLPPGFPYLTFFPTVVVATALFGVGPGAYTAAVCGLLARWFFIQPFGSLSLDRSNALAIAFIAGAVAIDVALIHWMQRTYTNLTAERRRTRALLAERERLLARAELLFDELQHRVANNLQMVGALLALQEREVADPAARQALAQSAERLRLIGKLQRTLYGAEGKLAQFAAFMTELVDELLAATGKPLLRRALEIDPDIHLPPDAAIPVALIAAEAVANALEHGFAGRDAGRIQLTVRRRGEAIELTVRDDGHGLPDGFDGKTSNSLGLRIVRTLAHQLNGAVSLERADPGARLTLTIPAAR